MTSRLKKRLDNIGLDPSSAKLNESFCMIGTPLPPLEKSKDTGEFVPVWKQEVRDEQGRRRLHGAFTGGFSAGYFNTVGSKEGWTPATFTSSRSDRAKQKVARPEDFMDEEDLAEMRDSQKLVDTTAEMDILGGTQAEMRKRSANEPEVDSMATALAAMLPSTQDSMGAQLLKKMGWRLGQGVGPRITYKQLKKQHKLSSSTPVTANDLPEDDGEANKHLYAPRDTKLTLYPRKDNAFGLAYVPGRGLNDIVNTGVLSGPKLSAGFGLGALNEVEDDDLDVYDGGFAGEKRRMAYDMKEDEDDDGRISIGGRPTTLPKAKPSSGSLIAFHDGRPLLPGFVLSDKPVAEDLWFELPPVPKGWTPDPQRVWSQDPGIPTTPVPEQTKGPVAHHIWKRGISADQRGSLLGETPLPAATRSVFDYLSQKDRDRLLSFKKQASGQQPILDVAPSTPTSIPSAQTTVIIPPTDPRIAEGALRGFQPFSSDPVKQSRYTAYLQCQASTSPLDIKPRPGQSIDAFNRELSEYAKSALIFKPATGAIASRFTSASVEEVRPVAPEGLFQPTPQTYLIAEEEKKEDQAKRLEVKESPKEHAAKLGMYGRLTREESVWYPAKLLCKRFGVRDPRPADDSMDSATSPVAAKATALVPMELINSGTPKMITGGGVANEILERKGPANVGLGEDESQGIDTLTYEKPAMDIFKAIFASDDEDSDEETEVKDPDEKGVVIRTGIEFAQNSLETPVAGTSRTSPLPTTAKPDPVGERLDLASFRPTFVSKAEREGSKRAKGDKQKGHTGKSRHADTGTVSFVMDVDGEEESFVVNPNLGVSNKKRRTGDKEKEKSKGSSKKKRKVEVGDEDMWVEKETPPAVAATAQSNLHPPGPPDSRMAARARAVDFL